MNSNNLKVLVTGASGLLGRVLMKEVENRGWNAVGIAFSR